MTSVNAPMSVGEAIEEAEELYLQAAIRMCRLIRIGMKIK
jgi:hypothetical protein